MSQLVERLQPILDFVDVFGPIGVGWESRFIVLDLGRGSTPRNPDEVAIVDFGGTAAGRSGAGAIRRVLDERHRSPELRVRLGSELSDRDLVRDIEETWLRLTEDLELTDAVAEASPTRLRRALFAVLGDVTLPLQGPLGTDYARVFPGLANAGAPDVQPFLRPVDSVDWEFFGKVALADRIGRHLNFALPVIEVG